MNVLILSAGTRNMIVRYFKNAVGDSGNVICADMSPFAPALYEADKYFMVPAIADKDYLSVVLNICAAEKVDGVLSLIDPELSVLARNKNQFLSVGTTVIGSSYELCEMALDKMSMYRWLSEHDYRCARSYDNLHDFVEALEQGLIRFPVFVKPIRGSASLSVSKVNDLKTLKMLFMATPALMVQEYLNGQEIGADVYIDMISGKVVSIFTKEKILMRSGETNKSVSFKDPKLFDLIERFVDECGWRGQIDIDIFRIGEEYYISEVNPRFGGGYPHAYECGCDHMKMIWNNLQGKENQKHIGCYEAGMVMMKYNEIMVRKIDAR